MMLRISPEYKLNDVLVFVFVVFYLKKYFLKKYLALCRRSTTVGWQWLLGCTLYSTHIVRAAWLLPMVLATGGVGQVQ